MKRRDTDFPQMLKKLRERKGISRVALSELCGLAPDSVRKYEIGEDEPRMSALISLAEYLEVSLDSLVAKK